MNYITEEEAYKSYLNGNFDNVMPFKSKYGERSYLDYLHELGIEIIESSEDDFSWRDELYEEALEKFKRLNKLDNESEFTIIPYEIEQLKKH